MTASGASLFVSVLHTILSGCPIDEGALTHLWYTAAVFCVLFVGDSIECFEEVGFDVQIDMDSDSSSTLREMSQDSQGIFVYSNFVNYLLF